ncbi:DUF3575 domain-containing protein [Spongiivirga citrea]|uniref:DUF3575 domain-containing protein n=1 Tax=Spongiivirga citrea TaxID=1481457 RepID=A0A6M0CK34_9FLAO|nr:DUF3575 domain-containing protein [Spongiivirga citrea]NER18318.1 DUF3575 domain-containing protein [Spongiivirga citrea]
MKKTMGMVIMLLTAMVYSQEQSFSPTKKNEFKANAAYLIAGVAELGYERLLNEESAIGVSLAFAVEEEEFLRLLITPYYRLYFGEKPAAGFFVEGFAMYNRLQDNDFFDIGLGGMPVEPPVQDSFALGFSIGGKFLSRKGFVAEVYGGIGRNFGNNDLFEFVPRVGVTLGKRF